MYSFHVSIVKNNCVNGLLWNLLLLSLSDLPWGLGKMGIGHSKAEEIYYIWSLASIAAAVDFSWRKSSSPSGSLFAAGH